MTNYEKTIKTAFLEKMKAILPTYTHIENHPSNINGLLFGTKYRDMNNYIYVQIGQNKTRFKVELMWGKSSTFPILKFNPHEYRELDELRFQIERLWGDKNYWWSISEDKIYQNVINNGRADVPGNNSKDGYNTVELAVTDCINRIMMYAIPYFSQVNECKSTLGGC